jgi:hypothetical protein
LDPDVALLGMSFTNEQDAALAAAAAFRPLSAGELAEVRRKASLAIEGKGAVWWDPK